MTLFSEEDVDIVISNQFSNSEIISDNIRRSGLFGSVEHVKNNKRSFRLRLFEVANDIVTIRRLHRKCGKYDEVCFSNISVFSILFSRFYQWHSPAFSIFEDGFVTYSNAFVSMDKASVISRILNPKGILGRVSSLYLFSPDILEWHRPNIHVIEIPVINRDDQQNVRKMNLIFGYDKAVDMYDRRYIFLEESFYADKFPVEDVEIVSSISDIVGKENLMVKLHPRNGVNRFEKMGIKTNSNYSIPWELIVLNQDIHNCNLISISSSAMLQPYLIFGIPIQSYALLHALADKPGNMKGELGIFMEKLFDKFPEVCESPDSLDTFYASIKENDN